MQYWRMKSFTVFADGEGDHGLAGVHTLLRDEDLDEIQTTEDDGNAGETLEGITGSM